MGCMSNKDSEISVPSQFRTNQKIADGVYIPQYTTLYNLLRKRSDLEIIRNVQQPQSLFYGEISFDASNTKIKPNDVKMLFNFKNILVVGGEAEEVIKKIKEISTPKCIYLVSQANSQQFLAIFPIFSSQHKKVQPKQIPILAFNQSEILKSRTPKEHRKFLFLHSERFKNQDLYTQLSIDCVVEEANKKQDQIAAQLCKEGTTKVLYLHTGATTQEKILHVLCLFLAKNQGIEEQNAKKYFENVLPQTKHTELQHLPKSTPIIPLIPIFGSNPASSSLTQNYKQLISGLHKQIGSDEGAMAKLERSYNLLLNLISNIYNNKEADNFRKVRKTNKQIHDLLGRYANGVRLLEDVGFIDQEGFYVNNTDIKYLRVYRMDLEVGYKLYQAQINNK